MKDIVHVAFCVLLVSIQAKSTPGELRSTTGIHLTLVYAQSYIYADFETTFRM